MPEQKKRWNAIRSDRLWICGHSMPFRELTVPSRSGGPEWAGKYVRTPDFETTVKNIYAVGDGAGIGGAHMSEMEGAVAGIHAAARQGYGKDTADEKIRRVRAHIHSEERFQRLYSNLFTPGLGAYELAEEDTLICRCEGVTLKKLRQMAEESTGNIPGNKNGSRVSMGECQGRCADIWP